MKESANKGCVQRHFEELWNHGEIEEIDEFFSQEFTNFGVPYSDVRGIIQHIIRTAPAASFWSAIRTFRRETSVLPVIRTARGFECYRLVSTVMKGQEKAP